MSYGQSRDSGLQSGSFAQHHWSGGMRKMSECTADKLCGMKLIVRGACELIVSLFEFGQLRPIASDTP